MRHVERMSLHSAMIMGHEIIYHTLERFDTLILLTWRIFHTRRFASPVEWSQSSSLCLQIQNVNTDSVFNCCCCWCVALEVLSFSLDSLVVSLTQYRSVLDTVMLGRLSEVLIPAPKILLPAILHHLTPACLKSADYAPLYKYILSNHLSISNTLTFS